MKSSPIQEPVQGKQRIAVYSTLETPVTGKQILERVRQTAPSITYQDLRHILRVFQQRGLAVCLNPECQTGRLYVQTSAFSGFSIPAVQIELCARISRAKTRRAVLEETACERFFDTAPLTATQIKKNLRPTYPLGLNHVLAALKFLEVSGLVETSGRTGKRELKIYRATDLGREVLQHLS